MPNRLAASTSPYLQQHRDNPVDWYEWGPEAFAAARERDVPLLISVGYAACHWCHVMAHESFEDATTAAFMNQHFVCIKVDREERPDVDAIYMEATQAMTGHGGWPMTVFATPDGDPFFCGTYFPPRPVSGMPSFPQVLASLAAAWTTRRGEVDQSASGIREALGAQVRGELPAACVLDEALLADVASTLRRSYDAARGGFGGAPKFPPSMLLEWLLRRAARTGEPDALAMASSTLEAMARGGMYDQLGGGSARYSVDAGWVVPHFEKMLYDNALLLRVYAHWWRLARSPLAHRVVTETADWLLRELRTPEGGFASALDADSLPAGDPDGHPHEGAFYVWTPEQLVEVLGDDDAAWAAGTFDVTAAGTFEEGASVLQLLRDPTDADGAPDRERWADVRRRLAEAREARPRPARDDKVIAAWNGLAIAALADAGALLERADWVDAAVGAAALLERHVTRDGDVVRLARASRDGVVGAAAGVLEDYADVAEGLLALYSATGDEAYVVRAGELLDEVLARFSEAGAAAGGGTGFYDTAVDETDAVLARIRRPRDVADGPTPSGQAAAAGALVTYAALTGSLRHREAAEGALTEPLLVARRYPRAAGWALATAEALL
ncbi:thioredoxin domain-containing protein, partial [Actinotalea sp. JY-7885]|uniref:thioredoxin domain-containing protein n=1 Tax=Actinotalea sp. JY-7885 TaxID=2758576 RepID=UPI00165D5995